MNKSIMYQEALTELLARFGGKENVAALIVRGSYSRDEADEHSDIDVTLLAHELDEFRNMFGMSYLACGLPIGIRVDSYRDWQERDWTPIEKHAYQTSKVVLDKQDVSSTILRKCIWPNNDRLNQVIKLICSLQSLYPFFSNEGFAMTTYEICNALLRGNKALSHVLVIEAIEKMCSIMLICHGIYPPEKKLFWTDYVDKRLADARCISFPDLQCRVSMLDTNVDEVLNVLTIHATSIETYVRRLWPNIANQSFHDLLLGKAAIAEICADDVHTAVIDRDIILKHKGPLNTCLDVGSGKGRHISLFRDWGFSDITCVDIEEDYVAASIDRGADSAVVLDLNAQGRLPFVNDQFDLVVLSAVSSYLTDIAFRRVIAEVARITRPDGTLVVTDFLMDTTRHNYFNTIDNKVGELRLSTGQTVFHRTPSFIKRLVKGYIMVAGKDEMCRTWENDLHKYGTYIFRRMKDVVKNQG